MNNTKIIRSTLVVLLICGFSVGCGSARVYQCNQRVPETTPLTRFDRNEVDGTVFDKFTNLTWKICAEGQIYKDGHCQNKPTEFTWEDAVKTFDGSGDEWRLPITDELESLIEKQCIYPTINKNVFPDFPASYFWSTSTAVSYMYGNVFPTSMSGITSPYVKLVKGRQWMDPGRADARRRIELAGLEEQKKLELELSVAQAEKDAYYICNNKVACEKAFSLTQIFINSNSDQKIQLATDTIVETFNPSQDGSVGMNAIKIPGKGDSAAIHLTATCKAGNHQLFRVLCAEKLLKIYKGFQPFINGNLVE